MKYSFTQDEWNICKIFAESVDTSFYAKRNQFNNDKRVKDSFIGKLGEFAVWNLLKKDHPNLTSPDIKIYAAKQKSWDFDLKDDNLNLHVKSQDIEQGAKYGVSWIFQITDKEIFEKTKENQFVAFTSVDLNKKEANVQAIMSVDFLHKKNLWAAPKLAKLKLANKVAVYLDDLNKYQDQLWMI
jgi:hypothetical protein